MKAPHRRAAAATAAGALMLLMAPGAQSGTPAPPFDVAYRAWEVVTELARRNGDPKISGACGSSFQAAAVPALRRQTRQEQDAAATACLAAARAACMDSRLKATAQTATKCREFR